MFKVTTDTNNHNSCIIIHILSYLLPYLPGTYLDKWNWYSRRNYDGLNHMHILTRINAPDCCYTIVLYGKTAIQRVKAQ